MKAICIVVLCLIFAFVMACDVVSAEKDGGRDHVMVKAKVKPNRPWKEYKTRTIRHLAGYKPGMYKIRCSRYGGWLRKRT